MFDVDEGHHDDGNDEDDDHDGDDDADHANNDAVYDLATVDVADGGVDER